MSNEENNNNEMPERLSRRDERALIFNLLYAADSFDYQNSLESIVDNYNRGFELSLTMEDPVVVIVKNIIQENQKLDDAFKPYLSNWRLERVGTCTKLILRYAMWELLYTDTPPNVVINEAVELAKCFAEKDAYRFVNGVLDEAVKNMASKSEESASPV